MGADGGLTVWASTQAVTGTAKELSNYFSGKIDLPESKVKCITHYMGGGFGSKFGPDIQGKVAAELALKAKAPVKLMLDRAEEVTVGGTRPSAYGKVKIAGEQGRQGHGLRRGQLWLTRRRRRRHRRPVALRLSTSSTNASTPSSVSTPPCSGPCAPRAIRKAAS